MPQPPQSQAALLGGPEVLTGNAAGSCDASVFVNEVADVLQPGNCDYLGLRLCLCPRERMDFGLGLGFSLCLG